MGNPTFRFSLARGLTLNDVQFANNEFEVSLDGWDQLGDAEKQLFTWDAAGAMSDGSSSGLANTSAIGRQGPINGFWPAGRYYMAVTAENLSATSGATAPFTQALNIWGSYTGSSRDVSIDYTDVYDNVGSWNVGDGAIDSGQISLNTYGVGDLEDALKCLPPNWTDDERIYFINFCKSRVTRMLKDHWPIVQQIAKELQEKKTLTFEECRAIVIKNTKGLSKGNT